MQTIRNWIKKQLIMFFVLIGFASALYAVEVQLYQVELPTQSQTGNFNQSELIKEAFQTVLVRVTGSSEFLKETAVTNALDDVDSYVKQFSYHQRSASEKVIKVIFNENKLNNLLKTAKQAIWDKKRPLILVWLANQNADPIVTTELEKKLNQRAIPFVFPLLDLTDTAAVSEQDLLGENVSPLEEAAKRYSPDAILSGRVTQQAGVWKADWRFINGQDKTSWENSDANLNTVLNQSLDALTKKLKGGHINVAASPAVEAEKPATSHTVILTVTGDLDAQQYSKILEHLRHLPEVREVDVAQILPDKILFEITTRENRETLIQSIANGKILSKIALPEGTLPEEALVYEVVGVL